MKWLTPPPNFTLLSVALLLAAPFKQGRPPPTSIAHPLLIPDRLVRAASITSSASGR